MPTSCINQIRIRLAWLQIKDDNSGVQKRTYTSSTPINPRMAGQTFGRVTCTILHLMEVMHVKLLQDLHGQNRDLKRVEKEGV